MDEKLQSEDIWRAPQEAAKISQEVNELKLEISRQEKWDKMIEDSKVLIELYNETDDETFWEELQSTLEFLEKELTFITHFENIFHVDCAGEHRMLRKMVEVVQW